MKKLTCSGKHEPLASGILRNGCPQGLFVSLEAVLPNNRPTVMKTRSSLKAVVKTELCTDGFPRLRARAHGLTSFPMTNARTLNRDKNE